MGMRRLILVVDDEMVNRKIIEKILSEEYDLLAAENGAQAMELFRAHGQEISVVLLDIVMPVMDGYEVLRRMRDSDELAAIPVIVSSQKEGTRRSLPRWRWARRTSWPSPTSRISSSGASRT